jgi:hypothetical protein
LKIGAEGCNFASIRHGATENDHCHIVFSRSKPNGTLLSDGNNRWTWRSALRKTEIDLGLEAPAIPRQSEQNVPTSDRMVNAQRRSTRLKLPEGFLDPRDIQKALDGTSDFDQFRTRLLAVGIQVKHAEKNGRVTGILFQRTGAVQWLAGSSIARSLTLPRIQAALAANSAFYLRTDEERQSPQHRLTLHRNGDANGEPNFERDT